MYTIFRLLAQGVLHEADGYGNPTKTIVDILRLYRNDAPNRNEYIVNNFKKCILAKGTTFEVTVKQSTLDKVATTLLEDLKAKRPCYVVGSTTPVKGQVDVQYSVIDMMNTLRLEAIKARSSDKADIRLVIHDMRTCMSPELGYSVKSQIGAAATLMNANKQNSNLVYEVEGITESQAAKVNAIKNFADKFKALDDLCAKVRFVGTATETLGYNLAMIDSQLARMVGAALLYKYRSGDSGVAATTRALAAENPCGVPAERAEEFYSYKMKQLLEAFALGMTVSSPWDGRYPAGGGCIIVKADGDIIAYHYYNRAQLLQYLYDNTRWETPSSSRHGFGELEPTEHPRRWLLRLGMQIRFMR